MTGKTDVIIQSVKLYIEGVQVPFESININQGVGGLPTANISIPPMAGLMDIARFYQPKVHIFFTENIGPMAEQTLAAAKARDKLLFTGHIQSVSYAKSTAGTGSVSINFSCGHKNVLITECLIDFTGWIKSETEVSQTGALKNGFGNSQAAIIEALQGIDFVGPDQEITKNNLEGLTNVLPVKFAKYTSRYLGMPGVLANYWNQLNRSAYNTNTVSINESFIKLYKPLIEDGLKFFDRIGGHAVIERDNQAGKINPCPEKGEQSRSTILIPPSNRLFLQSSVQAQMTYESLQNYLQATGEITNLYSIFQTFYDSVDYEMITLASPAEVLLYDQEVAAETLAVTAILSPKGVGTAGAKEQVSTNNSSETAAIETIIKPKTPFYFAPTCNVLFPGMYDAISVSYDESNIPTRVDMINHEMPQGTAWGTHFRSPHSVRAAIADAVKANTPEAARNLFSTIASSWGATSVYEQGRGIKIEYNVFPRWLAMISNSTYDPSPEKSQAYPEQGTEAWNALQDLQAGWLKRYPLAKDLSMCPWAKEASISAHHRILFASADYYFSMLYARSKAGTVQCVFNPYIIPGYPMDILEKSPVLPSFHAMCTSVTHNITSGSISTQVSFAAASTYSELANYYMPFILPALQISLKLAKNPTLVGSDPEAQEIADAFYHNVLGVGAAIPENIYDFETGLAKPIDMDPNGVWIPGSADSRTDFNGGELNRALSYEGNMELVSRPIENRNLYETRFGVKFIDLDPENYSPTVIKYVPPVATAADQLEIGASQFLNYKTKYGAEISTQKSTDTNTVDLNTGSTGITYSVKPTVTVTPTT
jgi:hypothetical protein